MFDGRKHGATPLVYPYHHAPGAPHTGIVYGRALTSAYAAAQLGSGPVLSQTFAVNMADYQDPVVDNKSVFATSPRMICEGYRRLDGTHLVAEVVCLAVNFLSDTQIYHKIEIEGGGETVDSGNMVEESGTAPEITGSTGRARGNERQRIWNEEYARIAGYWFSSPRVIRTVIEVALDPAQIGQTCRVAVYGCAVCESGEFARYRPQSVVAWQEVR